jgi:hypothetical protein
MATPIRENRAKRMLKNNELVLCMSAGRPM